MSKLGVSNPILHSPFVEPTQHWFIQEGETPELREGRRPAVVFPPRGQKTLWNLDDGTLAQSKEYSTGYELVLVNRIRERVAEWRKANYPGVTRTTLELLRYWHRDGRQHRLFFAQLEAVETIIFLAEARADLRQGVTVPRDDTDSGSGFLRHACKMATGSGKTTVMGMVAAWSILNKQQHRNDARFSDAVLVVCPSLTIKSRLQELDPTRGDSLYRTRDLVPPNLLPTLAQGRLIVENWHVFEPQAPNIGGESARVNRTGTPKVEKQTIFIADKTGRKGGKRLMTLEDYEREVNANKLTVIQENRDANGKLESADVSYVRYVESDTALVKRVLKDLGGKKNLLVLNDEAHHAYRIRQADVEAAEEVETSGDEDEDEDLEELKREATVWIEGLDRIHSQRGINLCVDLSATPYFLSGAGPGRDTNRPFPWVVSDFGLIDAIESGLVKIPQLAVRDTTGADIPGFFKLWEWVLGKMTPKEKGGKRASPNPEAVLKYAHTPIAMLGSLYESEMAEWKERGEPRPPVFILVCKNVKLAKVVYEWLGEGATFNDVPASKLPSFRNMPGKTTYTIRVDTKVIQETDTVGAKADEMRWLRFTLDTVGKLVWPNDSQGRPVYPEGFEDLAKKLNRPLDPPGRDVRCVVSVGMLTEGWDCNTVRFIVGLRPFKSQLLCEQVVGRGLRRVNYELGDEDKFSEEVATVFGVPFDVIPFKANPQKPAEVKPRKHIHALPEKVQFAIRFPRVDGYTQAVRNRIVMNTAGDPTLVLDPLKIPPEVGMKALMVNDKGRASLIGPGAEVQVTLREFRERHRLQELVFDMATALTREYVAMPSCTIPRHVLFPQLLGAVRQYIAEKVRVQPPNDVRDLFLAPYYGWLLERLRDAIRPDTTNGEPPEIPRYEQNREAGSTADVDFWSSREVRPVNRSHVNFIVADTKAWEQSAAYFIDRHKHVAAFVKNAGLGFGIPYNENGAPHDYYPDFLIRLKTKAAGEHFLILETKGFDPKAEVKADAATRWVDAVNAEGSFGHWQFAMAREIPVIDRMIDAALVAAESAQVGQGAPIRRCPSCGSDNAPVSVREPSGAIRSKCERCRDPKDKAA